VSGKVHNCKICNKKFDKHQSLGAHMVSMHNEKFRKRKRFKTIIISKRCIKCSKKFKVKRSKYVKNNIFNIRKDEKQFCSHKCANSHKHTTKSRNKISEKMKKLRKGAANKKVDRYCSSCKIKISAYNKSGLCQCCLGKTESFRKRVSLAVKGKTGGLRNGGGRGKQGWYKGYFCNSSWELAYVVLNIEHNIKFFRNKKGFKYKYEGKIFNYYPDFVENNTYIEIKGFDTAKTLAKRKNFKHDLRVISKNEIVPYIEYVVNKYGKDYIKLYDNMRV